MIHVEEVLLKTVEAIRKQRTELQSPCHALMWGAWGTGKTTSAKKIAKRLKGVFYMKSPADDVSRSKFVKRISHIIGAGSAQSIEMTLDLMKEHISTLGLQPILLIDEAQRIFKKPGLLDELKDLSEEERIELCYVFLGDSSVPRLISAMPHSIYRRIVIKVELTPITEKTVREIADGLNWENLYQIAKARGWTTLDVVMVASTLKRANMEATEENINKIAASLGR